VYRSTNAGDTWSAIDGNLPDAPVNDLLVDPTNTYRLYVATDVGVYTSRDLGTTWYALGLGLPPIPVVDLTLHAGSRTLVAATHGRSQWKFDLTQIPLAVGPGTPPTRLALRGPMPNPSRGAVRFTVEGAGSGRITAVLFDALGRRIATLLDGRSPSGREALVWDGRDHGGRPVRAGTYYLRVATEGGAGVTRRVVRLD
jgi:FlgD Ig-like domain